MEMNTITYEGLIEAVRLGVETDTPPIFLGTMGMGKSAGVAQGFKMMGMEMVDFRSSEILPEDVGGIGIPGSVTNENGTTYYYVRRAVPDLVQTCWDRFNATGNRVGIFLDELTSAVPAVQAALYQVLLDRKAGGHALPPETFVVGAGNLATDRGVVEELARPLLNRCAVYNFTGPTFDEFDAYMAQSGFNPAVRTFLKVNPNFVCGEVDPDQEQSPTPRSWERASVLLNSSVQRSHRMTHLAARVGDKAATKMEAMLALSDQLVPFEVIRRDPDNAPMPDTSDFAATYMQITAVQGAVGRYSKENDKEAAEMADVLWRYAKRFPMEMTSLALVYNTKVVTQNLLTQHMSDIQTAHDGGLVDVITKLAGIAQ